MQTKNTLKETDGIKKIINSSSSTSQGSQGVRRNMDVESAILKRSKKVEGEGTYNISAMKTESNAAHSTYISKITSSGNHNSKEAIKSYKKRTGIANVQSIKFSKLSANAKFTVAASAATKAIDRTKILSKRSYQAAVRTNELRKKAMSGVKKSSGELSSATSTALKSGKNAFKKIGSAVESTADKGILKITTANKNTHTDTGKEAAKLGARGANKAYKVVKSGVKTAYKAPKRIRNAVQNTKRFIKFMKKLVEDAVKAIKATVQAIKAIASVIGEFWWVILILLVVILLAIVIVAVATEIGQMEISTSSSSSYSQSGQNTSDFIDAIKQISKTKIKAENEIKDLEQLGDYYRYTGDTVITHEDLPYYVLAILATSNGMNAQTNEGNEETTTFAYTDKQVRTVVNLFYDVEYEIEHHSSTSTDSEGNETTKHWTVVVITVTNYSIDDIIKEFLDPDANDALDFSQDFPEGYIWDNVRGQLYTNNITDIWVQKELAGSEMPDEETIKAEME